jgi:hypothetical protein
MKRDDDPQLWDLLGRVAEPTLSPFFARNVLRRIRQEPLWFARARAWLGLRRLVPASTVALAVIAAVIFTHYPSSNQKPASSELDPVAKIDAQDYEVVADLDELLVSEDNNLWDDDSTL